MLAASTDRGAHDKKMRTTAMRVNCVKEGTCLVVIITGTGSARV